MPAEENRALVRRYVEEVWGKKNQAAIDASLAPNYKRHRSPTVEPLTREGQKQMLTHFRAAFPDIQLAVKEVSAVGNPIAFRSTMRGAHQDELLGIAATGKRVTVGPVDVIHIANGKLVEKGGGLDLLDLVQQLRAELP